MSVIAVRNVQKSFGKKQVLCDVSFTIDEPHIIGLVGPNGSGKSTLLTIMVNLLEADSGEVTLLGQNPKSSHIFNQVSFMKDNTVLYPYLTGWDHLEYARRLYGVSSTQLNVVIDKIGVRSYLHDRTDNYSLGMKQHLLMALAILNEPKLIIMDEPLTGLDPSAVLRMRELFRTLANDGVTILMSSHNLDELDKVTNHILFMKDGQIEDVHLQPNETTESYYVQLFDEVPQI